MALDSHWNDSLCSRFDLARNSFLCMVLISFPICVSASPTSEYYVSGPSLVLGLRIQNPKCFICFMACLDILTLGSHLAPQTNINPTWKALQSKTDLEKNSCETWKNVTHRDTTACVYNLTAFIVCTYKIYFRLWNNHTLWKINKYVKISSIIVLLSFRNDY